MATLKGHPRVKLSWDEGYTKLQEFYKKKGHSNVNSKVPGLGKWVFTQRKNRDNISPLQKALLDELDFTWDSLQEIHEKRWMEMYDKLVEYLKTYPGSMADRGYFTRDDKLQGWVCKLQTGYRKDEIRPDRVKMLDDINFLWVRPPHVPMAKSRGAAPRTKKRASVDEQLSSALITEVIGEEPSVMDDPDKKLSPEKVYSVPEKKRPLGVYVGVDTSKDETSRNIRARLNLPNEP